MGDLHRQVRELIEENGVLRSREGSSKRDLKNEIVELRQLANRMGEGLSEKDMVI